MPQFSCNVIATHLTHATRSGHHKRRKRAHTSQRTAALSASTIAQQPPASSQTRAAPSFFSRLLPTRQTGTHASTGRRAMGLRRTDAGPCWAGLVPSTDAMHSATPHNRRACVCPPGATANPHTVPSLALAGSRTQEGIHSGEARDIDQS